MSARSCSFCFFLSFQIVPVNTVINDYQINWADFFTMTFFLIMESHSQFEVYSMLCLRYSWILHCWSCYSDITFFFTAFELILFLSLPQVQESYANFNTNFCPDDANLLKLEHWHSPFIRTYRFIMNVCMKLKRIGAWNADREKNLSNQHKKTPYRIPLHYVSLRVAIGAWHCFHTVTDHLINVCDFSHIFNCCYKHFTYASSAWHVYALKNLQTVLWSGLFYVSLL